MDGTLVFGLKKTSACSRYCFKCTCICCMQLILPGQLGTVSCPQYLFDYTISLICCNYIPYGNDAFCRHSLSFVTQLADTRLIRNPCPVVNYWPLFQSGTSLVVLSDACFMSVSALASPCAVNIKFC